MTLFKEVTKGIIRENPTLVIMIGLCPTLAVTTSVSNAIGMGVAAGVVLIFSNIIIAIVRDYIPRKIRIPCYIVIMAALVAIVQMLMAAYFPDLNERLGIFIPLIVVNCIILGRAEAFAGKNSVLASAADGLGMGMGFTVALLTIATIREILGSWSLFGIPITESGFAAMAIITMPAGAFIVLSTILSIMNATVKKKRPPKSGEETAAEMRLFAAAKPEAMKAAKKQAAPGKAGG